MKKKRRPTIFDKVTKSPSIDDQSAQETNDRPTSPVSEPRSQRKKGKQRVTIYFDTDIVDHFKMKGETEGVGYQTLMNDALRAIVDDSASRSGKNDLKKDLLKDKKFLKKLKTALSTKGNPIS